MNWTKTTTNKRPKLTLWQRAWQRATAALSNPEVWILVMGALIGVCLVLTVAWPDLQVVLRRWN